MREWIEAHFPAHGIFGEEFGIKGGVRGRFPRYRWILDPIDGTRAFIHNAFHFGTLIAVERDDGNGFQPMLGVISHPAVGVWLIGDGKRTVLPRAGQPSASGALQRNKESCGRHSCCDIALDDSGAERRQRDAVPH